MVCSGAGSPVASNPSSPTTIRKPQLAVRVRNDGAFLHLKVLPIRTYLHLLTLTTPLLTFLINLYLLIVINKRVLSVIYLHHLNALKSIW